MDRSRPRIRLVREPLPGNPRCCCVRVCQSPVLIRGSGGRCASFPSGGGIAAAGGGQAHESDVRARRRDRRAQRHDQGRGPVPGREAVDPQDRDPGVPDVLRGAPADGRRPAPAGRHPRGDGGQRGLHRAGVLRPSRAGLHRGCGDQPGARQGAERAQDRREGLRAAGGVVRVRAAARVVYPAGGAEGGAGPDPVQDQDGPGPHLGDPAAGQGAGIGNRASSSARLPAA